MKNCKQCQWKFYRFIYNRHHISTSQAIFICPKCKHTTKGYTNPMGEFLGKVKGKREDKE